MTPNEIAAANLRRLRKARGWTQQDLAKRWGVSQTVVSDTEGRGRKRVPRVITINDAVVLAGVFEVSVIDLITLAPCATCNDTPPQGFTCQSCATKGEPVGGAG